MGLKPRGKDPSLDRYVSSGKFLADVEEATAKATALASPQPDNDGLERFPQPLRTELKALRDWLPANLCGLSWGDFCTIPELTGDERDVVLENWFGGDEAATDFVMSAIDIVNGSGGFYVVVNTDGGLGLVCEDPHSLDRLECTLPELLQALAAAHQATRTRGLDKAKAELVKVVDENTASLLLTFSKRLVPASRNGEEAISKSTSAPVGGPTGRWEVTILFERDETAPPYDLIAFEDELVGFNVHEQGPQLHRLAGSFGPGSAIERTVTNLQAPAASLDGVSLGPDGVLYAGGGSVLEGTDYTAVHVSRDRGRTWKVEEPAGLRELLGGTGLATTCWFEDVLWVANEKGIARQSDGEWTTVSVPSEHVPARVDGMMRYTYQAGRLEVVDGSLYFLGKGVARWNGEAFVTELEPSESRFEQSISSLVASKEGTLVAGGSLLWRKARGATWERTSDEALGIDPTKPKPGKGMFRDFAFQDLHLVGNQIVLVANKHEPWVQKHLFYVSDNDGRTYQPIPFERPDGNLVPSSSVLDAKGGVVVAGFGGTLLRLAPPRR